MYNFQMYKSPTRQKINQIFYHKNISTETRLKRNTFVKMTSVCFFSLHILYVVIVEHLEPSSFYRFAKRSFIISVNSIYNYPISTLYRVISLSLSLSPSLSFVAFLYFVKPTTLIFRSRHFLMKESHEIFFLKRLTHVTYHTNTHDRQFNFS